MQRHTEIFLGVGGKMDISAPSEVKDALKTLKIGRGPHADDICRYLKND